jgi:hypothetical protein
MKNSFLITMIAFASVGIISCTKTKVDNGPYPVYPPIEESRTVSSSWISMSFSEMTNDDGTIFLQADAFLDGISNVDLSSHTDFVYIKMQDAAGVVTYQRVPFNIADATEDISIGHSLDNGVFTIRVTNNSTTGQILSADRFQDCQFRLIMVSSADMASMQVDWDDYSSVEAALHQLQDQQVVE